jgi:hypothetical protein
MSADSDALGPWVDLVRRELGIDTPIDLAAILDVARVAAHGVARPAAPVTTFLLGAAAAQGIDPTEASARIARLVEEREAGASGT